MNDHQKRVIYYYDVLTEPYRRFWGDFFHPGIFRKGNESLQKALSRTRKLLLKDSKLDSSSNAIDLGCGIGALGCFISKKTGSRFVCTNFSKFQLKIAERLAKSYGVHNIEFKKGDIMRMKISGLEERFDAAFLIDVGCHLHDKRKALENIFQILKPSGRLLIMDWLQKNAPNSFERELLIKPFNYYWNFPYMESFEGYIKLFKKIGFKVVKSSDITKKVKKNWELFYNIALKEIKTMNIQKMLSYIKNPLVATNIKRYELIAKNQFYANVFAKICSDAGVFKYGYFVLKK